MGVSTTIDHIQIIQNPNEDAEASSKATMFFAPSKSGYKAKIWIMGVSTTRDHIQNKIKMPNPSQEPPASSRAPNKDLEDMDVLCTFKLKIESQKSDHGCIKDQ